MNSEYTTPINASPTMRPAAIGMPTSSLHSFPSFQSETTRSSVPIVYVRTMLNGR